MHSKYENLKHFTPEEFREWEDHMGQAQLDMLDAFRETWGRPCLVSPHADALGRYAKDSISGHNYERWEEVVATDIFPEGLTQRDFPRAIELALLAGATGVGIYADTTLNGGAVPMLHLDTRPDRSPETSRMWARINHKYCPIEQVLPADWSREDTVARLFPQKTSGELPLKPKRKGKK